VTDAERPKGLFAYAPAALRADTENHVVRRIVLRPESFPLSWHRREGDGRRRRRSSASCRAPNGLFAAASGVLYVTDSAGHRIRVFEVVAVARS